jgi:putative Ca2+/H+ antiporter (TMEM165/GDT1 family)
MSEHRPRRFRRLWVIIATAAALTTAVSTAVLASHVFTDVPDSNQFHGSIA